MSERATLLAIETLFAAIESRDLRRVEAALTPDATWQNLPHPASHGRSAVVDLLADVLRWSDDVRWDVETAHASDGVGRVVRIDRFWIDGTEHAVRCDGEFDVDLASGRVSAVRDRVDLDEWRARINPIYERMRARDADEIVRRHLDAVRRGDPIAMAADYALDATLVRGGESHSGWAAIADYFDGVPARLGDGRVRFGVPTREGRTTIVVPWSITAASGDVVASGRDTIETAEGFITEQVVALDGADF